MSLLLIGLCSYCQLIPIAIGIINCQKVISFDMSREKRVLESKHIDEVLSPCRDPKVCYRGLKLLGN